MWNKDIVKTVLTKKSTLCVSAFILGSLSGSVGSYLVVKEKLRKHYAELSDKEIEESKLYYARLHKTGEFADPVTALQQYAGILEDNLYIPTEGNIDKVELAVEEVAEAVEDAVEHSEPVIERNIFTDNNTSKLVWDYEVEQDNRRNNEPFIIHHDEFFENEHDFEQESLTYYENDLMLIASNDDVVENVPSVVGEDNLTRFGYGSNDNNIVYIRNERLEVDFEVIRSFTSYNKDVLGLDDDEDSLKHADHHGKSRRFRHEDE